MWSRLSLASQEIRSNVEPAGFNGLRIGIKVRQTTVPKYRIGLEQGKS